MSKISKSPILYYTDNVSFNGECLQDVYIPAIRSFCVTSQMFLRTVVSNRSTLNFLFCSFFMVQVFELHTKAPSLIVGPLDSEPYRSPGHCFYPCGHFAVYRCPGVCPLCPCLLMLCRPFFVRKFCPQLSRIISL